MAEDTATAIQELPETELAPPPVEQETEELAETGEFQEEAETETYTLADVEARIKEAEENLRQQAREEAERNARVAQRSQVEKQWQDMASADLWNELKRFAVAGAKWAHEGRTAEEVAQIVAPVHAKAILEKARETFMPYATGQVLKDLSEFAPKELAQGFPDWRPSRETETNFRDAMLSGDGTKMAKGLIQYVRTAIEESEVPAKVKATLETEAKKRKTASEVEAMKKASTDGPSRVAAGSIPGRKFRTQLEVDTAFSKGQIDLNEVRRQLAKNLPYS